MGTLIIFGIFTIIAFISGFFLGHYKREEKLPDKLPSIKEVINAVIPERPKKLSEAEKRELEKVNTFYS